MAQTGDPDGNGMGGSGQKLKAEFSDYSYRKAPWEWQELQTQIALTRNFSFAMTDVHI